MARVNLKEGIVAALLCSLSAMCLAQPSEQKLETPAGPKRANVGVGVIIGDPIGPTMKGWIDHQDALVGAAAWNTYDGSYHIHVDYVRHGHKTIKFTNRPGEFSVYVGAGLRLAEDKDEDFHVGFRLPVGLNYMAKSVPMETFLEFVTTVDATPDVEMDFGAAFGIRYWVR